MREIIYLSFCLSLVASASRASDWPMFRGNERRTGYYAHAVGYPKANYYWQKSFHCPIISSPAVVDQVLYIGAQDSCIYAIRAYDGQVLWQRKTNGWVNSSPLIHKNMVIVGSTDNHIYILARNTGELHTRLAAGHQLSSPAILNDTMILSGMGSPLRSFSAFHAENAKWDTTTASWSIDFKQLCNSSPSIFGSTAAIGAGDGKLYSINIDTRNPIWSLQTQGGVNLSTPAIDDTLVYFAPGNYDKNVYAVGIRSGTVLWKSAGTLSQRYRTMRTINPHCFIKLLRLSPRYRAIAFNRLRDQGIHIPSILEKSKSQLENTRSQEFFPFGGMKTSSVAVDEHNVYVIQKELGYPKPRFTLLALNKLNGKEVWRFSELRDCIKLGFCSSPVVTKHNVICGWGEGKVYAFTAKTGEKIWEDSLSSDIISTPAISDARLYVATTSGDLVCYGLNETAPGESFKLSTFCYPNPARKGVSKIQVYVAQKANMTMVIYNIAEKPVFRIKKTLAAKEKYTYSWDVSEAANGVYFALIRVKYTNGNEEKRILKIAVLN